MTQTPVQALKEFLIPSPEYSPDHFSSMFPLRLCLAQAPQLLPFALLEQEVHWQKKLVATTSPAKQHGQHKPSLENTMPCRQRLYVMFGYLPSGSSVKSPSWGSWAARVQTGRVHKQLLRPLSQEWTAASCCLSGCLDPPRPVWVPRLFQAWLVRALFWESSKTAEPLGVGLWLLHGRKNRLLCQGGPHLNSSSHTFYLTSEKKKKRLLLVNSWLPQL